MYAHGEDDDGSVSIAIEITTTDGKRTSVTELTTTDIHEMVDQLQLIAREMNRESHDAESDSDHAQDPGSLPEVSERDRQPTGPDVAPPVFAVLIGQGQNFVRVLSAS